MSHLIARNLSTLSAISGVDKLPDSYDGILPADFLETLKIKVTTCLETQNVDLERKLDAKEPIDEAEFALPDEYLLLDCVFNERGLINLLRSALSTVNYPLTKMIFDVSATIHLEWTSDLILEAIDTGSTEIAMLFMNDMKKIPMRTLIQALPRAVKKNLPEIVALMIQRVSLNDDWLYDSHTALFSSYRCAIMNGFTEIVKLFLEDHTFRLYNHLPNGDSIKDATMNGHMDLVKLLAAHIDPTFLSHAIIYLEYILERGAASDEEETHIREALEIMKAHH